MQYFKGKDIAGRNINSNTLEVTTKLRKTTNLTKAFLEIRFTRFQMIFHHQQRLRGCSKLTGATDGGGGRQHIYDFCSDMEGMGVSQFLILYEKGGGG